MQIILTEHEYKDLKTREGESEKEIQRRVNEICQSIADTLPIDGRGSVGQREPHGCIHSDDKGGYCDRCPARKFCTLPKNLSK